MAVVLKYVLLAVLVAGALFHLEAGARTAAVNFHRLKFWKRFPATVRAANDPAVVEVLVGSGPEESILKIPRTHDAGYRVPSKVTVIENPDNPEERRLTGIFDLWNQTLVAAIFGLALLAAAWLVWGTSWGATVQWSEGAWKTTPPALAESVPEFEVLEPRESWKANLLWGAVFGLVMGIPPFFVRGIWKPWPAIVAVAGVGFFLWMAQNSVLNYSRTVRLSPAGLEERSFYGARRIPWGELGGLEYQDVHKWLQNLNGAGRRQTRRLSTLGSIDVWVVRDREGRWVFSLPAKMTPADAFQAMREEIQRRTSAR